MNSQAAHVSLLWEAQEPNSFKEGGGTWFYFLFYFAVQLGHGVDNFTGVPVQHGVYMN